MLTAILDVAGVTHGHDETIKEDYIDDEGDPRVEKRLETIAPVRL